MKRSMILMAAFVMPFFGGRAQAEDPFAAGADALAVKGSDGSSSLRAKKKMAKMTPDMIKVKIKAMDDSKFPNCTFTAQVLVAAKSTDKHFKLIGRGKTYTFAPVLKMRGKTVNLKDEITQNNLGACYYPKNTKLVVKVAGVDLKKKVFHAAEIYLGK